MDCQPKGNFATNKMMMWIAIIVIMIFMLAVWLLLNNFFGNYVIGHINSRQSICDTFQTVPVLGTVTCPKT